MAQRIMALTDEQEATLPAYRDEWLRVGLCTDPADRHMAEAAAAEMYRLIGKQTPRFLWCESPATGLMAICLIRRGHRDSLRASLRDSLRASLRDSLRDSLGDSLWASLGDSLRDSLGDSLRASLQASLGDSLRASLQVSLRDSLRDSLGDSLWASLGECWWGQHEAYWVAYYRYPEAVLGVRYDPARSAQLRLWEQMCRWSGWWWAHEHVAVMTERPVVVKVEAVSAGDDRIRLHCADGPALAYRDGYALHAWHGVRVPGDLIEHPELITHHRILAEQNTEVARVMLERMTVEKFIREAEAVTLHSDTDGAGQPRRLLSVEMPRDPDRRVVVVQVRDPSTDREYLLRVPPVMRSCQDAVAWTFLPNQRERYAPAVER